MANSLIIDRKIVTANNFQKQMINKMFSSEVYENTIVENITYNSGGLKVKGYIAAPKEPGSYPVLLWNRGGYKERGALEDLTAFLILASTAVWGYVVVATQYRGNMGSEGSEDWAGKDLDDALNMLKVAEELPQADMTRVAIEGASRGGMTTYRILARDHRFKCGIVHAGLADLFAMEEYDQHFAKLVEKITSDCTPDGKRQKLSEISGVYLTDKFPNSCPILLLHGDADTKVPISQTESLVNELKKSEIPHEFVVIKGGTHVSLKDGSYREIDIHRKKWLEKHLK